MPPGVNPGAPAQDSFRGRFSQLPSRDANLVTTQTWGVIQRYIYSPYGSLIVLNADFSTPPAGTQPISDYLYQGMTLDAVTGLYYARNRNYSPSLGVWISQDPAGYINGADRYQLVGSGPVGLTDALGLWHWWEPWTWPIFHSTPAKVVKDTAKHAVPGGEFCEAADALPFGLKEKLDQDVQRRLEYDQSHNINWSNDNFYKGLFSSTFAIFVCSRGATEIVQQRKAKKPR